MTIMMMTLLLLLGEQCVRRVEGHSRKVRSVVEEARLSGRDPGRKGGGTSDDIKKAGSTAGEKEGSGVFVGRETASRLVI